MADFHTICQAIANKVALVPNIGRVWPFRFYTTDTAKLREAFTDNVQERLCAWTVSRDAWQEKQLTNVENERNSVYVIRGFYGVSIDGQSDIRFQEMIDEIADAFTPNTNLENAVEMCEPLQLRTSIMTYLQNGLGPFVHYCELSLTVRETFESGNKL